MASPILFSPFSLRNTEFKNRLWIPPMCQYQAEDGLPNEWHTVHYGALARGGAGLVIVEATGVVPEGRITPGCLGLWNDEQTEAFKNITRIAHNAGTKVAIQLAHAGRKASNPHDFPNIPRRTLPAAEGGWQTVAPSPIPFGDLDSPRELSATEIDELVTHFADAADRAVAAGFDAVELHAAHGYLIFEFLSPVSNKRTDEYGGPLAARSLFLRRIVQAIRKRHENLPILVRISGSEWSPEGFTPEDAKQVAEWLKDDGADFMHVSSAGNIADANIKIGPAYQTPFAATVRAGGLPVGAVGLIVSPEQAETILVTGLADVAFIGREALRNPFAPIHWAKALRDDKQQNLVPDSYYRAWPAR